MYPRCMTRLTAYDPFVGGGIPWARLTLPRIAVHVCEWHILTATFIDLRALSEPE